MKRVRKENQIRHCERCGKRLRPERGEPVEHGKMKVCQACNLDLNWFKLRLQESSRSDGHGRSKAVAV